AALDRDVPARHHAACGEVNLRRDADPDGHHGLSSLLDGAAGGSLDFVEDSVRIEHRRALVTLDHGGAGNDGGSDLCAAYVNADAELGNLAHFQPAVGTGSEHTSVAVPVRVPICYKGARMDRRLANRNIRTALIAGAISLIIFALAFVAAYLY